nr:hypothetical protein [Gilliamella apis]
MRCHYIIIFIYLVDFSDLVCAACFSSPFFDGKLAFNCFFSLPSALLKALFSTAFLLLLIAAQTSSKSPQQAATARPDAS